MPDLGGPTVVMTGWLAVVLLALAGRRRAAAAVASVPLALVLAILLAMILREAGAWSGALPGFLYTVGVGPVILASLAACSLAFSAGPRRGLAIVGRWRACLMVAGLSVAFGFPAVVDLVSADAQVAALVYSLLDVLAVVLVVAVTRVRGTAGGRIAVLMATGPLLDLVSPLFAGGPAASVVLTLSYVLLALLVWPLAIASWKRQVRRA